MLKSYKKPPSGSRLLNSSCWCPLLSAVSHYSSSLQYSASALLGTSSLASLASSWLIFYPTASTFSLSLHIVWFCRPGSELLISTEGPRFSTAGYKETDSEVLLGGTKGSKSVQSPYIGENGIKWCETELSNQWEDMSVTSGIKPIAVRVWIRQQIQWRYQP